MSTEDRIKSVVFHPVSIIIIITLLLLKPGAIFITMMGWSVSFGNFVLLMLIIVSTPYIVYSHIKQNRK